MFRILLRVLLSLVCLGAIAALAFNLSNQKRQPAVPQIFDLQKLEAASISEAYVSLSTIMPTDVSKVCILGPYYGVNFIPPAFAYPELTTQMDQSDVGESYVRIATFDEQSKILNEYDFPIGRGPVRVAIEGIPSRSCQTVETLLAKATSHENFITVQFSE